MFQRFKVSLLTIEFSAMSFGSCPAWVPNIAYCLNLNFLPMKTFKITFIKHEIETIRNKCTILKSWSISQLIAIKNKLLSMKKQTRLCGHIFDSQFDLFCLRNIRLFCIFERSFYSFRTSAFDCSQSSLECNKTYAKTYDN